MKKMNLSRKMYALIGLMTFVMALGTLGAYLGMHQILRKYGDLVKHEGAKQEAAKEGVIQLAAASRALREHLIRGTDDSAASFRDAVESLRDELGVYERLPRNKEEEEVLGRVRGAVDVYARTGEEILGARRSGAAALDRIREAEDGARETLEQLTGVAILNHDAVRISLKNLVGTMKAVHVGGSLIGIALAWVLSFILIRKVDASVRAVKEVAEQASNGDLTRDVPIKSDDEVGEMAARFNKMMEDLRRINAQIKGMTAALASSSTEVSATTDSLSRGAREQARQAEQAAAAITEMAQTVMDVAKNASEASGASRDASQVAVQGKERVENTVAGMHIIAGTVKESSAIIDDLGRSSREIGVIVNTINDIADQTNLLALNAAIEAARAGDYGRGFAVVADEVRKLAERTAVATQEITSMIGKVQSEAERSVTSMRAGIGEVARGVSLAEEAREALDRIVASSTRSTDMIQRIAAATEQQSAASEQVSANMESIAQTARTTESSLDQIRTSVLELSRLASDLDRSASWFKI